MTDWEKIKKCFVALKDCPDPKSDMSREQLVRYAANFMKPKANKVRLISQINYICFGL